MNIRFLLKTFLIVASQKQEIKEREIHHRQKE
jgi:hypothetical protein